MPRTKQFDTQNTLIKARDLFWSKGYYNTSIQDLVNALGINRASIYDTYGGKKELFEQAFEQYQQSGYEWMKGYFESRTKTIETFQEFFYEAVERGCVDPDYKGCMAVNSTTELVPTNSVVEGMIVKHKKLIEEIFASFIEKGKASNQVPATVDSVGIARLMFTVLSGLRVVGKVKPQKQEMISSVDLVLSLLN